MENNSFESQNYEDKIDRKTLEEGNGKFYHNNLDLFDEESHRSNIYDDLRKGNIYSFNNHQKYYKYLNFRIIFMGERSN